MPLIILVFFMMHLSCSDKEESLKNDSIITENPIEKINSKYRYYPSDLTEDWNPDTYWNIYKGQEPYADSLAQFYEAAYYNRFQGLDHGFIPEIYLQNDIEKFTFVDGTKGSLKGMEKLASVFSRIESRCPGTLDTFLPIKVEWVKDDDDIHNPLNQSTNGMYGGFEFSINNNHGKRFLAPKKSLNGYIAIKGEHFNRIDSQTYPNQTYKEIMGYPEWEIPVGGSRAVWALDETFTHELGHHFFVSWAVRNGKTSRESVHFGEYMAEVFRHICYGSIHESPRATQYVIENYERRKFLREKHCAPYPWLCENDPPVKVVDGGEHDFSKIPEDMKHSIDPYKIRSFEQLIKLEVYNNNFNSKKIWQTIVDTWDAMEGDKASCFPKELTVGDHCIWLSGNDGSRGDNVEDYPLIFTRKEFLRRFCDHYECGEVKYLFNAESIGYNLNFSEW